MPTVIIELFEGRPLRVKAEVAKAITEIISEKLSVSKKAVAVIFHEWPRTSFARGGVMAFDKENFEKALSE